MTGGTWDHTHARAIALGQSANVGHVAKHKPDGRFLQEVLHVDLRAHAAMVSDIVQLPARHGSSLLD